MIQKDISIPWALGKFCTDISYKILDLLHKMVDYCVSSCLIQLDLTVQSWRLGDNGERHVGEFRASCLQPIDESDVRQNPIHVGRERLLALEEGIERRYLKPPLGKYDSSTIVQDTIQDILSLGGECVYCMAFYNA